MDEPHDGGETRIDEWPGEWRSQSSSDGTADEESLSNGDARTTGIDSRTRRTVLKAAGMVGLAAVGSGSAAAHLHPDGPAGDHDHQYTEKTSRVGYHSLGGIGSASVSGDPDQPH